MSKENPSIGTCPCPMKGCDETCAVKKFAHRATTDQGRRKAGKFYLKCPKHNGIGLDAGAPMQEWILNNATMDGAEPAPRPSPKPAPKAPPSPPLPAARTAPRKAASAPPPPKEPAPERDSWTLL